MKKLSIISTFYNSAKYISKCLDTLVEQDIPESDYEIILVDDGSPDNTIEIAEQYAAKHPNIRIIRQENKGVSEARNVGIRAAEGKYMCIVDPDDYIAKNDFAAMLEQMERENLDMLRFNYQMVDEAYQPIPKPHTAVPIDYSDAIMDGPSFLYYRLGFGCFVWQFIYRTALIRDNGIWCTPGAYFDDTGWMPKVLMTAKRVNSMDKVHLYYYQSSNSLVRVQKPEAVRRKELAAIELIDELQGSLQTISHPLAQKWYLSMISGSALSVLVSAALSGSEKEIRKTLRVRGVYPLRSHQESKANRVKRMLVNVSPWLFCTLIRIKSVMAKV